MSDIKSFGRKSKETASPLLPGAPPQSTASSKCKFSARYPWAKTILCVVLAATVLLKWTDAFTACHEYLAPPSVDEVCSQAQEIVPEQNGAIWKNLTDVFGAEAFRLELAESLGGAVRIPTESFDDMGPIGEDPRWNTFGPLHDYLYSRFPLVHSSLKLRKINTYGLLYEWAGSDRSLDPFLLTAHQDVVPVEPKTAGDWAYPPFSGHYDGERVWGRGASDDKSGLIGLMTTMEYLLQNNFSPSRTLVLAIGFDEEISGPRGAQSLADAMRETYGEKGFAMILDEGAGYGDLYGQAIASPGIAEKGYVDVRVEVNTPGGHSSIPPPHTSIGMLSEMLVHLEKNPFEAQLARGSPMYKNVQCIARWSPGLDPDLRKQILRSENSDRALHAAEKVLFNNYLFKNMVGTTQAIDLIHGGVKVNALPEQVYAIVNHRISTESSVAVTQAHDRDLLYDFAQQFNLSYVAFGEQLTDDNLPTFGTLVVQNNHGDGLEPAPTTPTDADALPYRVLSGSIKAAYNSHRNIEGDDNVIVSPGIMSGNSDTRYYWDLSDHIFRYRHTALAVGGSLLKGVHTVNESLEMDNYVEMVRFMVAVVLNADETALS
ncbi:carboxypeptidase S [Coniophora puteana RWD-64-598 SS2]|uniref:Carboxypeptidase S n=1 Tax=Coniophora puteana (strain RWD-64-598) TaxID=741705 RepID=A0A5M3ML02_CONPW|nr:carboxypeptidase S [Coniophora puteana RWD-64-598 SS2]EIW79241.1 carboxypeptidase S [Coniophora puteana RWD-64-598 SS2]